MTRIFIPKDITQMFRMYSEADYDNTVFNMVYEYDTDTTDLEEIFSRFNRTDFNDVPDGYKSHSLSVGDVVELDGKYYYCDAVGWVEVSKPITE